MTIAPGVTVLTPGSVTVEDDPVLTLLTAFVSNGVLASTPWKSLTPAFHFLAADSVHAVQQKLSDELAGVYAYVTQ